MHRILLLLLLAGLAASCTPTGNAVVRTPRYRNGGGQTEYLSKSNFATDESRVVIYNARISMLVDNADSLNKRLVELSQKYNGYAVTLGNKSSTIRVVAGYLDKAIADLGGYGKIKNKTISGEDITEAYRDHEIRLDNAVKARQRYLELLGKAENVEAALKVEKELERLNGEIDVLTGKLERMKHLSDFSTIEVDIDEKQKKGILGYAGVGLYKGIKWLFVRS